MGYKKGFLITTLAIGLFSHSLRAEPSSIQAVAEIQKISVNVVNSLLGQIEELTPILKEISKKHSLMEKNRFLNTMPEVQGFLNKRPGFVEFLSSKTPLEEYLIKVLVVIHQADLIFPLSDQNVFKQKEKIEKLFSDLKEVESFYDAVGGVFGYHLICIQLLYDAQSPTRVKSEERYYPPIGIDLTQESDYLRKVIIEGIAHQGEMAELYPVGGAADRLNLQDKNTQFDLPAARLEFLGHTLLEGMIRDLQAREYLHFKLFGKQVITPIALMTSYEKNNDYLVQEIVRESGYFGRPKEHFKFFLQPRVPTFTEEGTWCLEGPMKLLLKPGGHGVIWKLALDKNVLEWFSAHHRAKVLVRQINNPIAGIDMGLIALSGVGCLENKAFGFASCLRKIKASEGMNILKEKLTPEGVKIALSNIEYCDFKKLGIEDIPKNEHEPYSVFPSNTNILFADLASIAKVVKKNPYPGMLVNFKKMKYYRPGEGEVSAPVARLELLMQNIADGFDEVFTKTLKEDPSPSLNTFITFNKRYKTISTTKKQFVPEAGLSETAFGCFYDYLKNAKELLEEECQFTLPSLPKEEHFLEQGPSFVVSYHPSLGPLYSVIGQKIRKGSLAVDSELQLEIADINVENLHIEGSLLVETAQVMGHLKEGILCYSDQTGRCRLKNVKIKNKGIDKSKKNMYWENKIERLESCRVFLEGFSEFVAEDVTLEGDFDIVVKDGERIIAKQEEKGVVFYKEVIEKSVVKPFTSYHVDVDQSIRLEFD